MPKVIFHLDMDAFYASVEQRQDPGLRDKPVIVGADPKGGNGRGVVVSCSYEARKFGVHSAMPISEAYRLCHGAAFLRPNFPLYERVSSNILRILRRFADKVEPASIDEAYLDVTDRVEESGGVDMLAQAIKEEIFMTERLTCSIGAGPNKIIAKIASGERKPGGLVIVAPHEVRRFMDPLPVSKIPRVGAKTTKVLEGLGIKTVEDLAHFDRQELMRVLGNHGLWIWEAANGRGDDELVAHWQPRSISEEATFDADTEDLESVAEQVERLSQRLHLRLVSEGYTFRTVGLKVRFEDFNTHIRSKTRLDQTDSLTVISENARRLLQEFEGRKFRLVGVRVSNLERARRAQQTLLS